MVVIGGVLGSTAAYSVRRFCLSNFEKPNRQTSEFRKELEVSYWIKPICLRYCAVYFSTLSLLTQNALELKMLTPPSLHLRLL